jgi:hypothetical protein
MKDRDTDTNLMQHLSGDPPREAFRQRVLRDSTAEFIRVSRRRSAWRRAAISAAAVLIAGVAFLGGKLSVTPAPPTRADVTENADTDHGVNVSKELVMWLEAARLFRRLGMEDRMARAVERAGRLLPVDTFIADGRTRPVFPATRSFENKIQLMELMDMQGPQPSAENINHILAQSFGD